MKFHSIPIQNELIANLGIINRFQVLNSSNKVPLELLDEVIAFSPLQMNYEQGLLVGSELCWLQLLEIDLEQSLT